MGKRPSRFNSQAIEAQRAMEALCSQHQLSPVKAEEDAWGLALIYQNSTTGLQLEYSPGEQEGWRAVIGRLVAGSFPKHPIHIKEDTELHRFDLRDLAAERIQDLPEYQDKISTNAPLTVAEIADIASRSAVDLLRGNFSVFPILRLRVLARAQVTRDAR